MKETKQQVINRLAADNLALREKNSILETELAFAKAKITEGDIRAKKLIKTVNRSAKPVDPTVLARREAMARAKALAMSGNTNVKVEF